MDLKNILGKLKILSTSMSFLLFSFAQAATYYVATSGSDSNAGTLAKPFKTIQRIYPDLTEFRFTILALAI